MSKETKNTTLIGGQALMEGVMMQGATSMAMTVRTESGEILTETKRLKPKRWYRRVPIIRGCAAFVASLINGTSVTIKSAEVIYPEEDTPSTGAFTVAAIIGVVMAIGLFILLPSFLTSMLGKVVDLGVFLSSLIEGLVRITLFVLYLAAVSMMKEIRRTFMYHGAEHRTINCFEKGMELTVENVQKCSTRHNRCGTTFLFIVMIVSILVFSLVNWAFAAIGWDPGTLGKMGIRLVLLPLVAGVSYEVLRLLALLPDNKFAAVLRAPGLALQKLTTYPPDDEMAEIAIISFNLVREMDSDPTIAPHKFGEMTVDELKKIVYDKLIKFGVDEKTAAEDTMWYVTTGMEMTEEELSAVEKTNYKQFRRTLDPLSALGKGDPQVRYMVYNRLKKAGITEESETYWMLTAALGVKRSQLAELKETTYEQYRRLLEILFRREKGEPLDYITGESEFYSLKFKVTPDVLIPRIDTEFVADQAIKHIKEMQGEVKVLDLMTGSGCIARAIAENTSATVTASDISEAALAVAKENLLDKATLVHSDVFAAFDGERFDVIISNPPYIKSGVMETLDKAVLAQPHIALDGGEDGLDFYRKIIEKAPEHLNANGTLMFEIGFDQREDVTKLLEKDFMDVVCLRDYAENDRFIKATLKAREEL